MLPLLDLNKINIITFIGHENLFRGGPRSLYNVLTKIVKRYSLKVQPTNESINLKDFRSSMATHFLKIGWNTDLIKYRLGHKPSSSVIDRYVSYLGLNKQRKEKVTERIQLNYKKIQEDNRLLTMKINILIPTKIYQLTVFSPGIILREKKFFELEKDY